MSANDVFIVCLFVVACGWIVALGVIHLQRSRPGLDFGYAVAAAALLRLLAAIGLSAVPQGAVLRGGDELTFTQNATGLLGYGLFSPEGLETLTSNLHVWIFSAQMHLGDVPELGLRVTQIMFAVLGIALFATAVHDIAGKPAGLVTVWLLAIEPTGVFFSSILHKEPEIFFAGGLATYGLVQYWKGGGYSGVPQVVVGCAIAVCTRPYAGWFLVAACGLTLLVGAIRYREQGGRTYTIALAVIGAIVILVPTLIAVSSPEQLERLQKSQTYNSQDTRSNLSLGYVDFSTREKVATNLPIRIRDVLLKPYPWQTANLSQRLGSIGAMFGLGVLVYLIFLLVRNWGKVIRTAGPFVFTGISLLVAYSISAGNAGTSFRYRTHLVAFALCVIVVLRERWLRQKQAVDALVVGGRVNDLRIRLGMTPRAFADRLGISTWQVSLIEADLARTQILPPVALERLATLFKEVGVTSAASRFDATALAGGPAATSTRRTPPRLTPPAPRRRFEPSLASPGVSMSRPALPAPRRLPPLPPSKTPRFQIPRLRSARLRVPGFRAPRLRIPSLRLPVALPARPALGGLSRRTLAIAAALLGTTAAMVGLLSREDRVPTVTVSPTPAPPAVNPPPVTPPASSPAPAVDFAAERDARESRRARTLRARRAALQRARRTAAVTAPVPSATPAPATAATPVPTRAPSSQGPKRRVTPVATPSPETGRQAPEEFEGP